MTIDPTILAKAQSWTREPLDTHTQAQVQNMIDNDPEELVESFYKELDFGTGGMRGIMGVGTNRINKYTLGQATQGLSNYLKGHYGDTPIQVAIAFDSRNNSKSLAQNVAEVFAGNGIKVFLFEDLRPTPELSFTIRHLGCQAGIVLTASHNPKEYNGYKVYWNDGGQLVPPHDKAIIEQVRKVSLDDIKFASSSELIETIGAEIDNAYLEKVKAESINNAGKDDLKIVFTALHGTSIVLMEKALRNVGFKNISLVEAQSEPNGDFPTVKSPNPEEAEALKLAVEQAEAEGADIVIGCDPDTDRVGIAVRDLNGKMILLNGNQTGAVLFDYMLSNLQSSGKLPANAFTAITIVTSSLMEKISASYGVETLHCLTGFKWIADLIRVNEGDKKFIVGGEESYGYMVGDFVRDKDAIAAAVMIAEAAAYAKSKGKSYYEQLLDIHKRFGFYKEHLIPLVKKGKAGAEEIENMMTTLRNNPPKELAGMKVVELRDYQAQTIQNFETGETRSTGMPASNVIQLVNENGDIATARPSGTEPKIKFYFSVMRPWESGSDVEMNASLDQVIEKMTNDLNI